MNENEIYTAIFNKAIANGWSPGQDLPENYAWKYEGGSFWVKAPVWDDKEEKIVDRLNACSIEKILFDHKFAKCLWGDKEMETGVREWKYNLQKLAISEDRVQYLSQFVDKELSTGEMVVDSKVD